MSLPAMRSQYPDSGTTEYFAIQRYGFLYGLMLK